MLKKLKRLTADNASGCTERMLNNIYAKNGRVVIRFTEDDRKDVDLCKYIAEKCKCNYSSDDIMEFGCGDCQMCPYGTMYAVCIQAAELRERLKLFEDKEEQGLLLELPCKVGDTVYVIPSLTNFRLNIVNGYTENNRVYEQKVHSIQMWNTDEWCLWTCDGIILLLQRFYKKTWFLTKEDAEAKLKELKENAE